MLHIRTFTLVAIALALYSCSRELPSTTIEEGDAVTVNVSFEECSLSRADYMDSGIGGLENIDLSGDKTIRYILQIYQVGSDEPIRKVKFSDNKSVAFDVRMVPGRSYRLVVWTDIVDSAKDIDLYYDTSDLKSVKVIGNNRVMNEYRDAFTGQCAVNEFCANKSVSIKLIRPFAKLRIITTDMDIIRDFGYDFNYGEITYDIDMPQSFNAYEGCVNSNDTAPFTYAYTPADYDNEIADDGTLLSGRKTIFCDYIFTEYELCDITFDLMIRDTLRDEDIAKISIDQGIPIARNHLTTIVGRMLTDGHIEGLYTPITPEGGDEF